MTKTLDRTKDIFLDTMLLGKEILVKKIKTTNKTKVTVVLAAFRNIDRLKSILENILKQSFQEFEIIVVDDSSSTEVEEFISSYDSSRLNYIKKQLGSNSSAKNCALEFAKGEYVVFLEENIRLKPDYIENLYGLVIDKSLDIAILTRDNYSNILGEAVVTGKKYLE